MSVRACSATAAFVAMLYPTAGAAVETAAAAAAPPLPPYDFTVFEDEVLPAWLARFTLSWARGQFSYDRIVDDDDNKTQPPTPSLYGSVDVIHVLATTGALAAGPLVLNGSLRDAWAAELSRHQNSSSGFYDPGPSGHSVYHAMGEATAALALLGRRARYNNSAYGALASEAYPGEGPPRWQRFFDSLYFNNCTGVRPGGKPGCGKSIHGCGQVIGSYPAVLAYTTGGEHAAFIRWWSGWLAARTSRETGTLCPRNGSVGDLYDSLGGGMATHGIQLGIAAGAPALYPFELAAPQQLLAFSLSLQRPDGAFDKPPGAALGSLTLDGIFQAVRASEQLQRHGLPAAVPAVQAACGRVLALSAAQLNNGSYALAHWGQASHDIANVVAAVGECARAFPQLVRTRRPWGCCARYV